MGDDDKNIAQGDQSRTKSEMNQIYPCPIPDECKNRDPQEYKRWSRHEFTRKSEEEQKIAVGIQLVENCILTKSERIFSHVFLMEKNKNLIECKQTQFMIDYLGCKNPEDLPGRKGGTKKLAKKVGEIERKNIVGWRYTEWIYDNTPEEEIFEIPDTADFGWLGDGYQPKYEITGLKPKKEGATETFNLIVKVDGKKMRALRSNIVGPDEVKNYDYSFDRETGTIEFTKPPPDKSRITASGTFLWKGPGKQYHGRSLSVAKMNRIEEKGELHEPKEGRFYLGKKRKIKHIVKNTVTVKIDGKLLEPYKNYDINGFKEKGRSKFYLEFDKEMRKSIRNKVIEVTYAEFKAHNTVEGYKEVEKKDFENVRKEALNHLSYFSETIRNANTAKYQEDFGDKMDLNEIKTWIRSWKPPTDIKLTENIYERIFYYECETPGCHYQGTWQSARQEHHTVNIAPDCGAIARQYHEAGLEKEEGCGKPCKVAKYIYVCANRFHKWEYQKGCLRPYPSNIEKPPFEKCPNCNGPMEKVDNLTYLDLPLTSVSLNIDDYFDASKKQGPIVAEALPVYYLYARPKPGGQCVATEDEVLNKTKTPNLKDVAFRLKQQLLDIHTNAETNNKPIYIHFWGYSSHEAGCKTNEALSKRRGEWVWRKLVTILTRDYEFSKQAYDDNPPYLLIQTHIFDEYGVPIPKKVPCAKIVEEHGCGKRLADDSKERGNYNPEEYRVIIIELSDDPKGKLA
jgi:hypothetical protein